MKIYRLLSLLCLSVLWLFIDSCQPQPEPSAQSGKTEAGARNAPSNTTGAGPYTLTFVGVTYANGQSTFTYQVQRTGRPQGNGLSHLIFGIGCATRVAGGTIDGRAATLAYSEGRGTGCQVSGNIVKFDNIGGGVSDGNVHIFTMTLAGLVAVAANDGVWVKAGNACYQSTISGPGCGTPETYELGGRMEIRYCGTITNQHTAYTDGHTGISYPAGSLNNSPGGYGIHVAGIPVLLMRLDNTIAATEYTDSDGLYKFTNVPAGSYTVKIDVDTYNNTYMTNPAICNKPGFRPIIHVEDMLVGAVDGGIVEIPSSDYDQVKNKADFWLDTFMPNTCGPNIEPAYMNWDRGNDSYNCP